MKRFWLSLGIFFSTLLFPLALPVFLYHCYKSKWTIWQCFKPIILAILVGCLIFILFACLWMWGMNDFCNQAEQNGYFMMNVHEFVVEVIRQLSWKLFQFAPDGDERGDGYLSAGSLPLVGHAAVMYNLPSSRTLYIDFT